MTKGYFSSLKNVSDLSSNCCLFRQVTWERLFPWLDEQIIFFLLLSLSLSVFFFFFFFCVGVCVCVCVWVCVCLFLFLFLSVLFCFFEGLIARKRNRSKMLKRALTEATRWPQLVSHGIRFILNTPVI